MAKENNNNCGEVGERVEYDLYFDMKTTANDNASAGVAPFEILHLSTDGWKCTKTICSYVHALLQCVAPHHPVIILDRCSFGIQGDNSQQLKPPVDSIPTVPAAVRPLL